ncbi:hypothetical protein JKP88DRAFT_272044 [Tribonema minus]|uniref:SnoaL-like domain-containing protein n=1 Tax=Tribonema minus TaxID=303371 RepID=A0A836CFM1_9STRA|nr:hypothetical protein JKP88DRAFT_272044 [Tribonema minus]
MRRDDMGPEEWDVETKVAKLESSLSRAVKEERYAEASELRDALSRMHMDDYSAVLAANADFYSAFSKKNADKMASLWLASDAVLCVHPGQEPLVGHEAVTKAWRGMFASGDAAFKSSVVQPKGVRVSVRGTSAWVTCTEEVSAARGQPPSRSLVATNVFAKVRGRWALVHHHASQSPTSGMQEWLQSMGSSSSDGQGIRLIKSSELGSLFGGGGGGGGGGDGNNVGDVLEALRAALSEGGEDGGMDGVDVDVQFVGGIPLSQLPTFGMAAPGVQGPAAHGMGAGGGMEAVDAANLARKTVDALRRLGREGRLNQREKAQLITDVIKHAAGEEASMAEIAYELLLAHDNEDMADQGRVEDFVDQCKALTEIIATRNRAAAAAALQQQQQRRS